MKPHAIDVHSNFSPEPYLKLIDHEGASFGAAADRVCVGSDFAARLLRLR